MQRHVHGLAPDPSQSRVRPESLHGQNSVAVLVLVVNVARSYWVRQRRPQIGGTRYLGSRPPSTDSPCGFVQAPRHLRENKVRNEERSMRWVWEQEPSPFSVCVPRDYQTGTALITADLEDFGGHSCHAYA